MAIFRATPAELAAARLHPSTLAAITEELYRSGYVVLADVVPHEVLDRLAPQLDLQAAQHVALKEYAATEGGTVQGVQTASARGWSLAGGFPR
eukprot:SAG31_NODE_25046_length_469_cov_0.772973_1_plen_92_part_10